MTEYTEPENPVGTVAELFAGVGGFRIGMARAGWKTVFSNQWEPATKAQPASDVYEYRFGSQGHTNRDISAVLDDFEAGRLLIPKTDVIVGGFPCQDYSVAKSLNSAAGLAGKKGVLWWEILRLVRLNRPAVVLLENVDRLLKSPASQRGRDFAVMLASLSDEGYFVEWKVVNAAEYGAKQRRKRVFIVGKLLAKFPVQISPDAMANNQQDSVLTRSFPSEVIEPSIRFFNLEGDLADLSTHFGSKQGLSPFLESGMILDRNVFTFRYTPIQTSTGKLGDVLEDHSVVPERFYIPDEQLPTWKYLKDAKKEPRTHKGTGTEYIYAEGKMAFPDLLTNPSRTILTGEGGTSASRFKHVIQVDESRFRRLTPIELERLNGFPDDWTRFTHTGEISDAKRAFFMGNALVIDLVERIARQLATDFQS